MLDKIKTRYKKFTEDNHLWFDRASALVGLGGGLIIGGVVTAVAASLRHDRQVIGTIIDVDMDDAEENIMGIVSNTVRFDDGSYITFHESTTS